MGTNVKYRSKVSGPLLDRIDIHIDVPPVRYKELSDKTGGEWSQDSETVHSNHISEAIQSRSLDRGTVEKSPQRGDITYL